jgi:hypothetical protein
MYTKEQIRKGVESALFDPNKKRGVDSFVDFALSEIERLANSQKAYIQPLSVEIIDWIYETGETSNNVTIRKDLRLSIEITAAFVGNSNDNAENLKRLKVGWHAITRGVLDGEYEIRTTNTNINPNCHLVPLVIQRTINSDKILLEVVFTGDMSDYILYSAPRLDLIRLSILDGRLVIKAHKQ